MAANTSEQAKRPIALVVEDDVAMRTLVANAMEDLGFDTTMSEQIVDTVALAETLQPDIVLLDLNLGPGPTGLDLIDPILDVAPYCAILLLSTFRSPQLVKSGPSSLPPAVSFFCKRDLTSIGALHSAVEAAMDHEMIGRQIPHGVPVVSRNQAEVLRMMAQGMSNEAIRRERGCSIRAVERMVGRLFASLGVTEGDQSNMRAQAVRMYLESDIVVK